MAMTADEYRVALLHALVDQVSGQMLGSFPANGEATDLVLADMIDTLAWLNDRDTNGELRIALRGHRSIFAELHSQGYANPASVASVHAEVLHALQFLEVQRYVESAKFDALVKEIPHTAQSIALNPDLIEESIGEPSWVVTSLGHKTLCYACRDRRWLCFDLILPHDLKNIQPRSLSAIRLGLKQICSADDEGGRSTA